MQEIQKLKKRGGSQYQLPRPLLINTDFDKIIQSDEIQNVIRGRIYKKRQIKKKNPLKNFYSMVKLNPFALTLKRLEVRKKARKEKFEQLLKSPSFKPSKRVLKNRKLEEQRKEIEKNFHAKIFDFDAPPKKV